jgi:hypothetical protein
MSNRLHLSKRDLLALYIPAFLVVVSVVVSVSIGIAEGRHAVQHSDRNRCFAFAHTWDVGRKVVLDLTEHIEPPLSQADIPDVKARYLLANDHRDRQRADLLTLLGARPHC